MNAPAFPVPPSLIEESTAHAAPSDTTVRSCTLLDLMYDGFYALFLLKHRCAPKDDAEFGIRIRRFLQEFERNAKKHGATPEDIQASKYAFCAAVDELILCSHFSIRASWETRPLQLMMFGDQLAGETFFVMLEELREKGAVHLQALEVFQMCLMLGFRGKYLLEGTEKLNYLIDRLNRDIALMKGKPLGFAPQAERPDNIVHRLRTGLPIWAIASVLALTTLAGYGGIRWILEKETQGSVHGYDRIIQLAPKPAHLTITWP